MEENKISPVCLAVPNTKFDNVDGNNVSLVGMGKAEKTDFLHLKEVNVSVSKTYNTLSNNLY